MEDSSDKTVLLPVMETGDSWAARVISDLDGIPGLTILPPALAGGRIDGRPDVMAFLCAVLSPEGFTWMRPMMPGVSGVPKVLIARDVSVQAVQEALRLGFDEMLLPEDLMDKPGVAARLGRLAKATLAANGLKASYPAPTVSKGRIVTILSGKGGEGKTFVSVNLAVALASKGLRVAIADLDVATGSCALLLDMNPALNCYDAMRAAQSSGNSGLSDLVESYNRLPGKGCLEILASPGRPELSDKLGNDPKFLEEHVSKVLVSLRDSFDYVIVDTDAGYSKETLAAIDTADILLLLCTGDIQSIRASRVCLEVLGSLGCPKERVRLIHNRRDERMGIGRADIESTLGQRVWADLPSDPATLIGSVNAGVPAVLSSPRSRISKALAGLARKLVDNA